MKRKRKKTASKSHLDPIRTEEKQPRWFIICLLLLVGLSIVFKLYKAHISGMMIDEGSSVYLFSDQAEHALTRYPTPNNHVLHSLMLCFVRNIFESYIHWFRIPAVIFGIIYSISVGYIAYRLIGNRILALGVLTAVLFSQHVFDYSYLARGYAISLGGYFAGLALVIWLLKHPLSFRFCWIPIAMLSLVNFICLGSMPSTIFITASLNLYVILLCSHRFFSNPPNRWLPGTLNVIMIPVFSGLSLYLLYRRILPVMAETIRQETKPGPPFWPYMERLLADWGVYKDSALGTVLLYALLLMILVAVLWLLFISYKNGSYKKLLQIFNPASPAVLITVITLLSFAMMFVYRNILNKGLGYPRNQIYLIPLTFLCIGMLFDRLYQNLSKQSLKQAVVFIVALIFIGITVNNFPSFYGSYNKTCSKPILDKLRQLSSEKTWVIRLSRRMRNWPRPLYYYNQYGYKTVLHRHYPKIPYDVTVWYFTETPDEENPVFLDYEYFYKHHHVLITMDNPQLKKMLSQSKTQP